MQAQRNLNSSGRIHTARYYSHTKSSSLYGEYDNELAYQFKELKKQIIDQLKEIEKYPRYNRQLADEKSEFYKHMYLIQNSCINHITLHPEINRILQKFIETLETLNELMKKVRKLKGSDLELILLKNEDQFEFIYKQWNLLLEKQLNVEFTKINASSDDKMIQIKVKLQDYFYLYLTYSKQDEENLKMSIQQNLKFDENEMSKVSFTLEQITNKVKVHNSILFSNQTLEDVTESYFSQSHDLTLSKRKAASQKNSSNNTKSEFGNVKPTIEKIMSDSLADILFGECKLGRTPRRKSGYEKTPRSEERKSRRIGAGSSKDNNEDEDDDEQNYRTADPETQEQNEGNVDENENERDQDVVLPPGEVGLSRNRGKASGDFALDEDPDDNTNQTSDIDNFNSSHNHNIKNAQMSTPIQGRKKRVKIHTANDDDLEVEQEQDEAGHQYEQSNQQEEKKTYFKPIESGIIGEQKLKIGVFLDEKGNEIQSTSRISHKIKPPTEFPKTKPKILKVTVIDIKSEVPSEFSINQDIADITSDQAEKNPVIFGKGEGADIRFSGDNIYIADKQFRIEYERPHFSLVDIGTEYPTLIRLESNKKVLLSRYDYISLAEQSDFYIMDLVTDDLHAQILNDSQELRYFDAKNEPKISNKKSITIKFHDGALAGNKFVLEQKRTTVGRSNNRDMIIPSTATTVSKLHATIMYERGYWYLMDHSTYGTFMYPRTVVEMKNHKPSSRIKVHSNMKVSVGGHMLLFTVVA